MANLIRKYVTASDRKKTVSNMEFNSILEELKEVTTIFSTYVEKKEKEYFYCINLTKFPSYPDFIGKVHSKYGRNIEISTYYYSGNTFTVCIRGNSKEVKKHFKTKNLSYNVIDI